MGSPKGMVAAESEFMNHLPVAALAGEASETAVGERGSAPVSPAFVLNSGKLRAVSEAKSFAVWVTEQGSKEQRDAVIGHVSMIWGDWNTPGELGFLETDHTEKAQAETVAEAFAGWEDNADTTVRAAVYGKGGELLYATEPKPEP
ncbi:hypothetical protein [Streptomyces sp. NPDC055709]